MKKFAFLVSGLFLGGVFGTLLSIPFNHWYATRYIHADEDANFLVSAYIFGFLPIFSMLGLYTAHKFFKYHVDNT